MKRRDFITLLGGATTGGRMAVRVNRQRAGEPEQGGRNDPSFGLQQ